MNKTLRPISQNATTLQEAQKLDHNYSSLYSSLVIFSPQLNSSAVIFQRQLQVEDVGKFAACMKLHSSKSIGMMSLLPLSDRFTSLKAVSR